MTENSIRYDIKKGSQIRTINILDEHADLNVTDDEGNTLLHIAFKNEEPSQARIIQVFEILLKRGIDINAKNVIGRTILHFAIQRGYRDVIDFCIRQKADLNVTDWDGNTLAHYLINEKCRQFHSLTGRENLLEIEHENSSFVDWIILRGIDFFHKRNRNNQSAFYLAIELNLQHILLTLLKHVTDFPSIEKDQTSILCKFLSKKFDSRPPTSLHTQEPVNAVYYGDRHVYNIVKIILENNRSMSNETLNSALRTAIKNDEPFDVIDLIINHTASVKRNPVDEESLIQVFTNQYHKDVYKRRTEFGMRILKGLAGKGADINEPDENGETIALTWFRYHPKLKMLRLLQACGADFSKKTKDGENYLHLVCRYSNEIGMVRIVAVGCDVNTPNSTGEIPLKLAIAHRNIIVAMDLIGFGANVNDMRHGSSPLYLACEMGQTKVVEKMIQHDADLSYKDYFGKTLLHLPVNTQSMVELLLKNGLDVNVKDTWGQTPLHLAENVSVIETLVDAGAFVDLPDEEGRTPLYSAISRGCPAVIQELLKRGANIREPKVFHYAIDPFQYSYLMHLNTSRYIMEHLIKMCAVGLLEKISHADEKSEQQLQIFFNKCQEEVKLLKDFSVDDCTSLYQWLHRNRNRKCAYVDNERLKTLVGDRTIAQQFPNYFVLIIGYYNEVRTRKPLMQEAICVLKKMIKVSLPDLCIDKILIYLSNMDLAHFIEAGKIL